MGKTLRDSDYREIIYRLQDAREDKGLTQTELADMLGKPQSYISKTENFERCLNVLEFVKMARALGFDVEGVAKLLDGRGNDGKTVRRHIARRRKQRALQRRKGNQPQ